MFALQIPEIILLSLATILYAIATIIGIHQVTKDAEKYRNLIQPLVCTAIVLEAIILIFRAAAIKAIPLTGLFESMIVLTIIFGLIYLFHSLAVKQVWFNSIMVWVIMAMILLTWVVAKPASEPVAVAATPWAIAHGAFMLLGGASVAMATASAFLYLFGSYKLKHKKIMQVLGKIPNIEKLESMNLLGLRVAFFFISVGLISGLGLAVMRSGILGISIREWLTDSKVICIIAVWALLAIILLFSRLHLLKDKARAMMTIIVFVLILSAILGVTILGVTHHQFAGY